MDAIRRKREATFSISDNGIGIPAEFHERVFRMFERLHPEPRCLGTGIGLTMTRKIAESARGRMWIEAPAEGGTRMCIVLPVAKE